MMSSICIQIFKVASLAYKIDVCICTDRGLFLLQSSPPSSDTVQSKSFQRFRKSSTAALSKSAAFGFLLNLNGSSSIIPAIVSAPKSFGNWDDSIICAKPPSSHSTLKYAKPFGIVPRNPFPLVESVLVCVPHSSDCSVNALLKKL